MAKLEEMGIKEIYGPYTREEMVLVRITELERKVRSLEFAIDKLTQQIRELNYRLDHNRGVEHSD